MIDNSDSRYVVRFCYHSYDYRLNWSQLSPITIAKCVVAGNKKEKKRDQIPLNGKLTHVNKHELAGDSKKELTSPV